MGVRLPFPDSIAKFFSAVIRLMRLILWFSVHSPSKVKMTDGKGVCTCPYIWLQYTHAKPNMTISHGNSSNEAVNLTIVLYYEDKVLYK